MTETEKSLTHSFFRQAFLMKLLNIEHSYFLKNCGNSGVKNVLLLMKKNYETNIPKLTGYLAPKSREIFNAHLLMSEEKITAIGNILEKLSLLDEAGVLQIESDLMNILKTENQTI